MEGGAWKLFQIREELARRRGGKKRKEGKPSSTPCLLSPQNPEVLSLGLTSLDTNRVPTWPGLRTLLQQLPPQDIDVGLSLSPASLSLASFSLQTVGRTLVQKSGNMDLRPSSATSWGKSSPTPFLSFHVYIMGTIIYILAVCPPRCLVEEQMRKWT